MGYMRYVGHICHSTGGTKANLLEHINKMDPAIKFTVDGNQENGTIPFLNTLVKPKADNTLSLKSLQENHTHPSILTTGQPLQPSN